MGHCFELKHWSVVFKISVRDLQSSDKPDLEEDKAAIKPEVPQSSPKWLMLVWVFFFHSCFQNTPHHSHIQPGGEHRESKEIQALMCAHALSHPTLCDSMDLSRPGSSVQGISQARILEWGCHFLFQGIFPTQGLNLCLLGRWIHHWDTSEAHVLRILPRKEKQKVPDWCLLGTDSSLMTASFTASWQMGLFCFWTNTLG